jgi:hypothetical protein
MVDNWGWLVALQDHDSHGKSVPLLLPLRAVTTA